MLDGGRVAVFKVRLGGPKKNDSNNPISTKVFCDSQRNPDIECYNSDFADLFDDIDSEPIPNHEPESNSTTLNSRFLEFLDETVAPNVDNQNSD